MFRAFRPSDRQRPDATNRIHAAEESKTAREPFTQIGAQLRAMGGEGGANLREEAGRFRRGGHSDDIGRAKFECVGKWPRHDPVLK